MSNYLPVNDAALASWLYNLVTGVNTHLVDLGLDAADLLPVQTGYTAFNTSLTTYNDRKILLTAGSNDKKVKKTEIVDIVRPFVQRIQHAPGMTDAIRGELGLPVRGTTMHTAGAMPPDVPGIFLEAEPGTVWVHFGTNPQNEMLNGKPGGVKGCNIWRQKAGETAYSLVAYQAASPYKDTVDGAGSDYMYVVQYRGNKASDVGESSPSMTIAARGNLVA